MPVAPMTQQSPQKASPAQKKPSANPKLEALQSALTQIEKQYGVGAIMKMDEMSAQHIDRFSSGSIALDLALGGGLSNEESVLGRASRMRSCVDDQSPPLRDPSLVAPDDLFIELRHSQVPMDPPRTPNSVLFESGIDRWLCLHSCTSFPAGSFRSRGATNRKTSSAPWHPYIYAMIHKVASKT